MSKYYEGENVKTRYGTAHGVIVEVTQNPETLKHRYIVKMDNSKFVWGYSEEVLQSLDRKESDIIVEVEDVKVNTLKTIKGTKINFTKEFLNSFK